MSDPVVSIIRARNGVEFARFGWKGIQYEAKSRGGAIAALAQPRLTA
jgi:hypothetical protein